MYQARKHAMLIGLGEERWGSFMWSNNNSMEQFAYSFYVIKKLGAKPESLLDCYLVKKNTSIQGCENCISGIFEKGN